MASSIISFAQEEIVIPCDQCDMSADSYCRDCCVLICDICQQSHLQHTIVPVLEGLNEKFHVVKCLKHSSRFTNYCKLCNVNICDVCTTTDHRAHESEPVGKQAKTLIQNFSNKISIKKAHLKKIKAPLSIIRKRTEDFDKNTQKQIDKVRLEIVKKKELLDAEGETIIESLKDEYKIAFETLNTQYRQLKDLNDKLNELIESMEGKLASLPDEAVFNFVIENEKELQTNTSNMTFDLPRPSVFIPSLNMNYERSGVIGSLYRVRPTNLNITFDQQKDILLGASQPSPTDLPAGFPMAQVAKVIVDSSLRRKLNIINRFTPKGDAVFSISATDDDMFWVGTDHRKLALVDKTGKRKLKVKMSGEPWSTAVTRAGDALVSTRGHVIYKVTRKGKVSKFVDISPGEVWGITATQDGDVFACVYTNWGYKVKKFSSEGNFVLELDSAMLTPGNRMQYVHAVRDDVICIQDGDPGYNTECHLVFVTAAGQLVSRVTRTGKLQEDTRAIVWDNHGNMLTVERWGEYMHVFSGEGARRHSYKVKEGQVRILSLCLGKDGAVWIGTGSGEVITARYLQ